MQREYEDLAEQLMIHRLDQGLESKTAFSGATRTSNSIDTTYSWEKKVSQLKESLKKHKTKYKRQAKEHKKSKKDCDSEILRLKVELAMKDKELHHVTALLPR
ncbi:hypothetical protein R1flu_000961 [Riccia fluitans]|uniref:Uncharacterized protein n=1 Tax=Riccia fluitans TaxID=41844 RepID=A0ABD1Y1X5_9MARC